MVVGPDYEGQLARYHEFECTGISDQYVSDVDITEKARALYEEDTTTRLQSPDDKIHAMFTKQGEYKKRFLRDPTSDEQKQIGELAGNGGDNKLRWTTHDWKDGKGYRTRIVEWPEGWKEIEVPTKDHETFAKWITDYYGLKILNEGIEPDLQEENKFGYVVVDAVGEVIKAIDRTNVEKKWDWYQVGGRWTGFFKLKAQAVAAGAGAVGDPGLMTEPAAEGYADQCLKSEIDVEGMRADAAEKAAKQYDLFASVTAGLPPMKPWTEFLKLYGTTPEEAVLEGGIEAAREAYRLQPMVVALRENKETQYIWSLDEYLESREEYIQAARDSSIAPFAVVKDGAWNEKGSMGWFGCVSDEKAQSDWNRQVSEMFDALPDDTLLTIVDAHI
jgi:hypothetical protein